MRARSQPACAFRGWVGARHHTAALVLSPAAPHRFAPAASVPARSCATLRRPSWARTSRRAVRLAPFPSSLCVQARSPTLLLWPFLPPGELPLLPRHQELRRPRAVRRPGADTVAPRLVGASRPPAPQAPSLPPTAAACLGPVRRCTCRVSGSGRVAERRGRLSSGPSPHALMQVRPPCVRRVHAAPPRLRRRRAQMPLMPHHDHRLAEPLRLVTQISPPRRGRGRGRGRDRGAHADCRLLETFVRAWPEPRIGNNASALCVPYLARAGTAS